MIFVNYFGIKRWNNIRLINKYKGFIIFFSLLFASKNQKQVRQWVKEHKEIVSLAHKVIKTYDKGNFMDCKEELRKLYIVAIDHLMSEDLMFYRISKEKDTVDEETMKLITGFKNSFHGTKTTLMNFLTIYTRPDSKLDKEFIDTFHTIVGILNKRINFEENNLYSKLKK